MDRVKKRLAYMLAVVLMFALVAPAAPQITANAATKKAVKNPITELGIKELPEGNTVRVGDVFNFNPDIIATERGKGKTTGIVWWEVNARTNAAGVSSSRWGYVYPVYEGSFEIRALAFANTKDLNAWKAARKANGNVADEAAMSSYVTAVTDWVKINVVSDTEGYAVARTQYQLNLALKNKKATDVHIKTDKEVAFTIPARNYTSRTLTVDAPNAEVENAGRFAQINIRQIKTSTFTEKAYGNRFHVTAPNARLVLLNKGGTKEIVFEPEKDAKNPYIIIIGENSRLNALDVAAPGRVEISGVLTGQAKNNAVVVNVAEEATGTGIQTEVALEVNAAADVAVTVEKAESSENVSDAAKTVINMEKAAKVAVDGTAANGTTVVVKGGAKGSEIASDASLIIIADADVTLNLTENAAGTTVTKGENVKIVLAAESTVEGVVVTDPNGKIETVKPGEDSLEVTVAPSATPAPSAIPTTTPSGGSSGGSSGWTPSYPSNTPTPVPTNSASYSVDGKTEKISFENGSKETVIALPADSQSKTLTLTVNGSNAQKVLAAGINTVSVGGYTVKFIVPLAALNISASLSDIKMSAASGSVVTGSAILLVKVADDLSAFMDDPDFTVSYEWKVDGTVLSDVYGTSYQKEVEVTAKDGVVTYTEPGVYSVAADIKHGKTGNAVTMQSNSLQIDIRQEGKEPETGVSWFEEQGLTFSPQGNFGFTTSVTDDAYTATIGQVYIPGNIVVTESTEGMEEGYKAVTAEIYLNPENVLTSGGNRWMGYVDAFDRYSGTMLGHFDPDAGFPTLQEGDEIVGDKVSVSISYGDRTYDISKQKIYRYSALTFMVKVIIICPKDYDGTVFQVGKYSPELAEEGKGLEKGHLYKANELPWFGRDYLYFSETNSEYNDEYCGIYQEWLENPLGEVLTYSISGGKINGEIRGERKVDSLYNMGGSICMEGVAGATIKAKLVKAGEQTTVTLDDEMVNVFSIGKYGFAVFNPNDPTIVPTSVSAKYNMVKNEAGDSTGKARVVLSARFDESFNPQYKTKLEDVEYSKLSYGIRWCNAAGETLAEVSWNPEFQLWYGGAAYEGDSTIPGMYRTIENGEVKDIQYYSIGNSASVSADADQIEAGKGVDCAVELPASQVSDMDGCYADVVFYFKTGTAHEAWVLGKKKVVEDMGDAGEISFGSAKGTETYARTELE